MITYNPSFPYVLWKVMSVHAWIQPTFQASLSENGEISTVALALWPHKQGVSGCANAFSNIIHTQNDHSRWICAAEIVRGTTKNAKFNRYLADCSDIVTIRNVLQRCQIQRKHGIHNNNAQFNYYVCEFSEIIQSDNCLTQQTYATKGPTNINMSYSLTATLQTS